VAYLRRLVAQKAPFFLWASHVAPHASPSGGGTLGPPKVAPRDAHVLGGVRAPSLDSRSFDVPGDGAAGLVGLAGTWSPSYVQHFYTQRIRALQSADRAVARAVRLLRRLGQLDNTYVFFASDNGFLLAQHRLIGKNVLYEENLRVPVLVRGPAVQHQRSALPVTLVDLAPTILQIAGASAGVRLDGRSFLGDLRGRRIPWRDSQLIQTGRNMLVRDGSHGWTFRGVRTGRYTYGRDVLTGQRLLFDRRRDHAEVRNVAAVPAYRRVAAELERRTRLLTVCSGRSCNRSFGPVGPPVPGSGAR
jgi:N-acetylglucosamine-6-sulfatase